jgi:hypothetical protein
VCARGAFSPLGPTDRGDARDVLYVRISLFQLRLVNPSKPSSELATGVRVVSTRFVFV